ncbi:hypothetical protein A9404_03860 [Halothiobacillus diazotrophicus]|uniref:Flagellar protein FliL n=1 Tax=Halothiobacillus diazotrophicus TaxID=1860122 RepID=A0A191ZFI4_9GAMM|nr:flagellar basal body-associated FliL family protein [Halothiobacillus diazotrophicus]ANJ66628.1 hypothetical protein A9404_03860 [Halothiobacillus diazotrophicus]
MAKAEAPAEATESPAKKGGGKLLIILMIVIIVLLLAVVGIGAFLLLKKPAADPHAAGAAETHQTEGHDNKDDHGDKSAGEHKGPPITITLDQPITVNLSEPNDAKLLQVQLDLITYDAKLEPEVKANRAEIINDIMLILSDVNAAKLRTREGKEALQKQIKDEINKILEKRTGKKNALDDVYFTKLLMQ